MTLSPAAAPTTDRSPRHTTAPPPSARVWPTKVFALLLALCATSCGAKSEAPAQESPPPPQQAADPASTASLSQQRTAASSGAQARANDETPAPSDPKPQTQVVFRPTQAPELTTRERLARERSKLQVETLADGTTKLDLRGHLHQAAVARITEDGKLERGCVDTPEALDQWVGQSASPATEQTPR